MMLYLRPDNYTKFTKPPVVMFKIIGARVFDWFLWIICLLLLYFLIIKKTIDGVKYQVLVLNLILICCFLIFFVLIPGRFYGQTIGRKLFSIKIVTAYSFNRLSYHYFLLREGFIVLLPNFLIGLIAFILSLLDVSLTIITRITGLTFFWFIILFIFQKINPNQQIFVDRYFHAWIVEQSWQKLPGKKFPPKR